MNSIFILCIASFISICTSKIHIHEFDSNKRFIIQYSKNIGNYTTFRLAHFPHLNCTEIHSFHKQTLCHETKETIQTAIKHLDDYIYTIYNDFKLQLDEIIEVSNPFTIKDVTTTVNERITFGNDNVTQNLYAISHENFCSHKNNGLFYENKIGIKNTIKRRQDSLLGQNVVVYVIDTGVDCNNTELNCNTTGYHCNTNDIDGCKAYNVFDLEMKDTHGHGTHCAGIISGQFSGIAPNVTLVPIKTDLLFSSIENAFELIYSHYLQNNSTKRIISLSIGQKDCNNEDNCNVTCKQREEFQNSQSAFFDTNSAFYNAHMDLYNAGIPIIKSAGNYPCNVTQPWIKYNKHSMIVVGNAQMNKITSLTNNQLKTSSSYCGINHYSSAFGELIDIQAPGTNIFSSASSDSGETATVSITQPPVSPSNLFIYKTGTSMASALVAGIVALMMNTYKNTPLTVDDIRSKIQTSWCFKNSLTFFSPLHQNSSQFHFIISNYTNTTRNIISSYNIHEIHTNNNDDDGLSTAMIIGIACAAAAILIWIAILYTKTRSKTTYTQLFLNTYI